MKRIVLITLIIVMTITMFGCSLNRKTSEGNMLRYINEKYPDDKFEFVNKSGGGAGSSIKTIIVSSEKYPGKNIYVHYVHDAEPELLDNYLGIVHEAATVSLIREILDETLGCEYILFYQPSAHSCEYESGLLSFEEYIKQREAYIGFTIVAKEMVKDKEKFETELQKKIAEAGMCCMATIYFDNGSGAYDTLTLEKLSGYTFKKMYCDAFSFKMQDNTAFKESHWENTP